MRIVITRPLSQPPAVVLGTDCLTGLQTARILWRKGVPVVGVAENPKASYCRTRATKRVIAAEEFKSRPVEVLKELAEQFGARPVLQVCTDEFVTWLDAARADIEPHADFLLTESESLNLLLDKASFYRYAIDHSLPLSETRFVTNDEQLEAAANEMSFPMLAKPPMRSPEWMAASGGFKVSKVANADELRSIGPALVAASGELVLQGWVRGPDANMHSLYVCMDRNSEPLACVVTKKLRQWPPDVGVGSLAVEVTADEVVQTGLQILKTLKYVGPGSFQFKQDEVDRRFYLIEMNTRSPLNFGVCEASGVQMTYTCYCAAAGLPLPEDRAVTRPGGKWICWKTDTLSAIAHWRRGDLTIREWLRSIRGHKWSADLQWSDPLPFFANLLGKLMPGSGSRARKVLSKR